ncbi:hypothetical protein KAR48_15100 [bacterium]|nr:hypothetical protein [bacterium]
MNYKYNLFIVILISMININCGMFGSNSSVNINPTTFDFASSRSFFYHVDNRLFYSENGKVDEDAECIWRYTGEAAFEETFVSPDSKYIIVRQDSVLLIISNQGEEMGIIGPVSRTELVEDRKAGQYRRGGIQWSPNSDYFIITRDEIIELVEGSSYEHSNKNRTAIFKYCIQDRILSQLLLPPNEIWHSYYLSRDEESIFCEYYDREVEEFRYKRIRIDNGEVMGIYIGDVQSKLIDSNDIYVQYKIKDFVCYNYDLSLAVVDVCGSGLECGLYLYNNNRVKMIFSGSFGTTVLKGMWFSFLEAGYFLPGNRYYIAHVDNRGKKICLVVDTKENKYMELKELIVPLLCITNDDCPTFWHTSRIVPKKPRAKTSIQIELESER